MLAPSLDRLLPSEGQAVIRRSIRVLTLIESSTTTGRTRSLIEFARRAAFPEPGASPIEITIATYQRGSGENPLVAAARKVGLPAYTIFERGRFDPAVMPQLRHIVDQCQPDILESRNTKSHFLVRLLGLHKKYRWIAWNDGYTAKDWLDRTYNQLDRWAPYVADRVVTVCSALADKLARRYRIDLQRIAVLPNFVSPFMTPPLPQVQNLRQRLGLTGKPVVLSVGRLSHEKGHADLLLAAAALVHARAVPDFRLVLVGEGAERRALVRLAARLGIERILKMVGFQRDVDMYYRIASVFALPSHTEGCPNVILEAMAAGLPVVATGVGGVTEILQDQITGIIVPPHDPPAMASALLRVLTDARLRAELGSAARARAESCYTAQKHQRALVKLYEEVLEDQRLVTNFLGRQLVQASHSIQP